MENNIAVPPGKSVSLEHLTQTHLRVISNGFLLKTRSGLWYYPTEKEVLKAVGEYIPQMVRSYNNPPASKGD